MPPPARPSALVADDDPSVRSFVACVLALEFDITAVADGPAAERALLADPGLAVAVLDCDMPGLRGPDVLARARAAGCAVPVLLVSGGADPLPTGPRSAFLAKPFTPGQLTQAVADLIRPPA